MQSRLSGTRSNTEPRVGLSDYVAFSSDLLKPPGTSQVVTADESGMAASLTTTVNLLFGSQLMVPETGVIMNDEMNDFSIPGSSNAFGYIPSPANYIRPGKRPLSSISPTIVESADGRLYFVVGSAGGSRIITATIQNVHHVLDQRAIHDRQHFFRHGLGGRQESGAKPGHRKNGFADARHAGLF